MAGVAGVADEAAGRRRRKAGVRALAASPQSHGDGSGQGGVGVFVSSTCTVMVHGTQR